MVRSWQTPHTHAARRTLVNLLQDADEASLPAILNCMHFLCDNDPAAQVTCAATATALPRAAAANTRLLHDGRV